LYHNDNINDESVSTAPHLESLPEQWLQSQFSDYIVHIKTDYDHFLPNPYLITIPVFPTHSLRRQQKASLNIHEKDKRQWGRRD